jgi:hypothetical protein
MSTTTASITFSTTSTPFSSSTSYIPTVAIPECYGLYGIFPHPTDCAKFFDCQSPVQSIKTCSFGLMFNAKLNVCDWSYNVVCPGQSTTTTTTTTKLTTTTTILTTTSTSTTTTATTTTSGYKPIVAIPECNGLYGYYPHPTDCAKYLDCQSPYQAIKTCSSGLLYNAKLKICDWSYNVVCDKTTTTTLASTTAKLVKRSTECKAMNSPKRLICYYAR